jgi:circadian clock protein KaiC
MRPQSSVDSKSLSSLASTGVEGLDHILKGGLPRNRLYLIEGDPGVGKTTVALQFLLQGIKEGEKCLYVTLSETTEEILGIAKSHDWSLDDLTIHELSAPENNLHQEDQYTVFTPSEVELGDTTKAVLEAFERIQPTRVVFDSLSEMRLLAQSPLRYRRQILALKHFFVGRNCTVIMLDDRTSETRDLQLQSIVHGAILLEKHSPVYGKARRRLEIIKLRSVGFRAGYHDFNIEKGGLIVFPRLIASEHKIEFGQDTISSGIAELDHLLGGGLDRGTSTLILGPAGAGKSSLVAQYAVAFAKRSEKSIIFTFDEGVGTLIKRAAALDMDLTPYLKTGMIKIQQIDPAEMPPGEFVEQVRKAVSKDQVKMIAIDSLTGYLNAMPEVEFLPIQMHELLSYLSQQGIVTLLTMAQHGLLGQSMSTPVDVSYLADSVVLLRYFEVQGKIKKAISVVKKRSGMHETAIREYKLTTGKILLGDPLEEFSGVLTGVPVYSGKIQHILGNEH